MQIILPKGHVTALFVWEQRGRQRVMKGSCLLMSLLIAFKAASGSSVMRRVSLLCWRMQICALITNSSDFMVISDTRSFQAQHLDVSPTRSLAAVLLVSRVTEDDDEKDAPSLAWCVPFSPCYPIPEHGVPCALPPEGREVWGEVAVNPRGPRGHLPQLLSSCIAGVR